MATIGSLVFKIGADTAEIIDGVNKVNSKLSTMPQELERVQSRAATWGSFVGNVMADVAAKVGRLAVDAIGDLVTRSEKMSSVGSSFDRLTGTVGETGEAFLKVSRGAAKGLISDLDLMQAANKGILLGLPMTSQSFGKMAETAIVLGRAVGQGPNKSLDDLMIALGRSSPLILDNLGLTVKVGEANDKYAAQLGKSSSALTEAEKKTAFYNAAMSAAEQKVASLGGIQSQSTDILTKVKVAWDNLLDRMAKAISSSPVLQKALEGLSSVLTGYIAKLDQSATMSGKVDTAVLTMLKAFNGLLSGLNYVQGGFNAFQSGLAQIMGEISRNVAMSLSPLAAIFEQLAKLPGPAGDSARLAFAAISSATKFAGDAAVAYSQIQKEQEADYARNANAIQSLQSKLGGLIGELGNAKAATIDHTAAVREGSAEAVTFGKSISDMSLKIGNGFGLIKQHTTKVDIKEVMDRSIDSFRNVKVAADQSVPGFVSVGKAATSLFADLKKTTDGVLGLSLGLSAFSGQSFGQNFGSSMGFGKGMTIGVQGNITQAQIQDYYRSLGFYHSGGGIGFAGMKRYHSGGLMQGEVPIVAQEGEGILSRRGMAALSQLNGGGAVGGMTVNVVVNAQGAFMDTPDARERLGRMVGDVVVAKMKAQGARV